MQRTRSRYLPVSLAILFAPLFIFDPPSYAKVDTFSPVAKLYKQTVEKYHNEEFDDAIALSLQIRREYPDEPAGVFGLLITYQTIMRNYRVRTYEATYDSLLNLTINLSKEAIKKNRREGRNYFYLGVAYGSRSLYFAQHNKWMMALKDGSQVLKNFERAIKLDPEFYDSHYGIGLFKYWMSAKSKLLRFIPFSKDRRKEGIEKIQLVIEKGEYVNIDALYGLSSIYAFEGRYEEALQLTDQLLKRYPNNPTLHYRRGNIFRQLQRWREAEESFAMLTDLLHRTPYQCVSYQIEALYLQAECAYRAGHYLAALQHCRAALELKDKCDMANEVEGPNLKYADVLKQLDRLEQDVESMLLVDAAGG